jgi:hypothetical protein
MYIPIMAWFSLPYVSQYCIVLSATLSSLASSKRTISSVDNGAIYHFEAIINRQLMANNTQNQRCKFAGGTNDSCFMEACILLAGNPGYFRQTACLNRGQGFRR